MVQKLFNIILLLLLFFNIVAFAQNTCYYKISHKVGNTVKLMDGGQYITFSQGSFDKTCYESDSEGFSVKNGMMTYDKTTNGKDEYYGSCYWGSGCKYLVSKDKSSIIVTTKDKKNYTYTRSTAPKNQLTCSYRRRQTSTGSGDSPIYNPTISQGVGTTNSSASGGGTSPRTTTPRTSTPTKKWRNVTRTVDCPMCYHTGICQTCNGKGWTTGFGQTVTCVNCDYGNRGKCQKCHGSGTITKVEQVYE